MNIFVVATHQQTLKADRVRAELRHMRNIYPSLDVNTIWDHRTPDQSIQVASISAGPADLTPRQVVSRSAEVVTLFSGLPIDPENQYPAHKAVVLGTYWNDLRDRLDGTYAVVQISTSGNCFEIQTDLLGGEAVYYLRHNGGWLFSNSVLLLERLAGWKSLDSLGVSMYLHIGHAMGDRTLRQGIKIMGGAQRWTFSGSSREPDKKCYYPLSNLANLPRRELNDDVIKDLAREMQRPLTSLGDHFQSVVCPLTGGKDSRVIASLLMNADIRAQYFTFGNPLGDDARIASQIAREFNVSHQVKAVDESDVFDTWDEKCIQTVRSTDGMRSLHLLGGMSKTDPVSNAGRDIYLWGACGEVARSFFGDLPFLKRDLCSEDIKNLLERAGPTDSLGLIRKNAKNDARRWKDQCVDHCIDQGISLLDIPDVFGNHFIDARRLSNNGRGHAEVRDTYTPYANRAFLETAFSLSALRRYTEPLHYRILQVLSPGLHSLPFDKNQWRYQNPALNLANLRLQKNSKILNRRLRRIHSFVRAVEPNYSYVDSMFSRLDWFEGKRIFMREFALDASTSPIWDYVDRTRFEQLTSDETSLSVRSQNLKLLFHVVTLLYYDTDPERSTAANDDSANISSISAA